MTSVRIDPLAHEPTTRAHLVAMTHCVRMRHARARRVATSLHAAHVLPVSRTVGATPAALLPVTKAVPPRAAASMSARPPVIAPGVLQVRAAKIQIVALATEISIATTGPRHAASVRPTRVTTIRAAANADTPTNARSVHATAMSETAAAHRNARPTDLRPSTLKDRVARRAPTASSAATRRCHHASMTRSPRARHVRSPAPPASKRQASAHAAQRANPAAKCVSPNA